MQPSSLSSTSSIFHQHNKQFSEDFDNLQRSIEVTETSIALLPKNDLTQILTTLEIITTDLKKHAAEAIRLESLVLELRGELEVEDLVARLASTRTRIAFLLSQVENGKIAITKVCENQTKKQKELEEYRQFLNEIETWILTVRNTLENSQKTNTESQIQTLIFELENLHKELIEKERKLQELTKICEEFKKYSDLKQISITLYSQLESILSVFNEHKLLFTTKLQFLRNRLEEVRERRKSTSVTPDSSLENTLDSISMPIEEVSIHTDVKPITEPSLRKDEITGITIETQTGNSLKSSSREPSKKDFTVTYNQPVDAQIQAQLSQESNGVEDLKRTETITISKTIKDGQETIQIDTKPMASSDPQPIIEEPDDLLVEANYRKEPDTDTKSTDLSIKNTKRNQPFETIFVEPDETTTEVIVDADGSKRIIVKKLHRTVVRHQQTVQQQNLTSLSTLTKDNVPVTQSFSQVTLKGQQSSTTIARGNGMKETLTNRQYGGKIISGTAEGDIDVQEFQTEPESHYTVIESQEPKEVEVQGIKLHKGDVTFLDDTNKLISVQNSQIHTSSSSVRAVVQQVRRKIIKKTRKIIRRIVIVDGKEQITEEIIEEPEEVEVTDEGIPRVSINVVRTEDGTVVEKSQFGEDIVEQPGTTLIEEPEEIEITNEEVGSNVLMTKDDTVVVEKQPSQIIIEEPECVEISEVIPEASDLQDIQESKLTEKTLIRQTAIADSSESSGEMVTKNKKLVTDQERSMSEVKIHLAEVEVPQITKVETVISSDSNGIREENEAEQRYVANLSPLPQTAQHASIPTQTSFETHKNDIPSGMAVKNVEVETSAPVVETISIKSPRVEVETSKSDELSLTEVFIATEKAPIHPIEAETTIISELKTLSPTVIETEVKETTPTISKIAEETEISSTPVEITEEVLSVLTVKEPDKPVSISSEFIENEKIESSRFLVEQNGKSDKVTPVSPKKKDNQAVEISVTLEEKPMDWKFESAKISNNIVIEGDSDERKLQRTSDFSLPSVTQKIIEIPSTIPKQTPVRSEEIPSILEPGTPHETSITSSDIDHGGRKSKRKKKIKTPIEELPIKSPEKIEELIKSPEEKSVKSPEKTVSEAPSIATSLAESIDIAFSPDSHEEESPKPTFEEFEPASESEDEDEKDKGKDTGYEADKTTVDESLVEENDQDKKKRKKKKKKQQKIKTKETDESQVPQSISESSPIGDSVAFTDDEPAEKVELEVANKEGKKKKRKKGKKDEKQEVEKEKSQLIPQQSLIEEVTSPNDSYHTISTISEEGTVKVLEEKVISPEREEVKEISEEIVKIVPVLETVTTQEIQSQTSPEVEQVPVKLERVDTLPISIQTSPELLPETTELSIQTEDQIEEVQVIDTKPTSMQTSPELATETTEICIQTEQIEMKKAPLTESFSQVELDVSEIDTQTTPKVISPEIPKIETSMQTTTPEQKELTEEFSQTEEISQPKPENIQRTDSEQQTQIEKEEVQIQTSPIKVSVKETVEVEMQAQPSPDIHSVQTSPLPSAPPMEDVATETDKESTPPQSIEVVSVETIENATQAQPLADVHSSQTSPLPTAPTTEDASVITDVEYVPDVARVVPEMLETVTQTSPVIPETAALTPPSSPSEYEILVKASVTIPKDRKNVPLTISVDEVIPETIEKSTTVKEESDSVNNVEVEVTVDDKLQKKYTTVTDFLNEERITTEQTIKSLVSGELDSVEKPAETTVEITLAIDQDTSASSETSTLIEDKSEDFTDNVEPNKSVNKTEDKKISIEPIATAQKVKMPSPKAKTKNKHVSSVTIEEVQSSNITVDTPLTPSEDFPISPPEYPSTHWSHSEPTFPKQPDSQKFIDQEKQGPSVIQNINVTWTKTQTLERIKNLQNAQRTTHLSDVLYLATLSEVITEESIEQRSNNVEKQLKLLQDAVEKKDIQVIQQTIITTVETITTWLETIEYRIYVSRQQTSDGPSEARVEEFNNLKDEIVNIEVKIDQLQNELGKADDIYNEDDRNRMKGYIDSLQQQVKIIENVTEENGQLAADDLLRWNEFVNELTTLTQLILETQDTLQYLKESDASPQTKLNELDKLDNDNKTHVVKIVQLLKSAKGLMRDFPTKEMPEEIHHNQKLVKKIDQQISSEREKAFQLLSLADEYEQTLKEFSKIVDIAEVIVESPLTVKNLEHLENEMQNHRKFFVNLSHCRAILESLEENLDSETKTKHSILHNSLYDRARIILDKSTGRFQLMFSAASKWTTLEQGMKEEMRWLQVAQERVPDITNVTSSDYERYMDHYQSLSLDIDHHYATLLHLNRLAVKVQELVVCSGLDQTYSDSIDITRKMQEDVHINLQRLIAFKENWSTYNLQSNKLEYWLKVAEIELKPIEQPSTQRSHIRQFWELKAQFEVNNLVRQNATTSFETSMKIIPISDEMTQRKFHSELLNQWNTISSRISNIEKSIIETISSSDVPVNEKLSILHQELDDLKIDIDQLQGVIKNEEELNLYIERLQIMSTRLDTIQNELGKLGLLSANESDKVNNLLALSKRLDLQITEELEGASVLKDSIQSIQKGLDRLKKKYDEHNETLDKCESSEKMGSAEVQKAVEDCYGVDESLVTLWQDVMSLRQLLHTLPMRLKVTVSPVKVERDISQIQDQHTALERRCGQLLALLRSRLNLWQRFERQLELVQESVQEADFMIDLLTVQGTVDYERLKKATERLESVSVNLVNRENLVDDLKIAAQPLTETCSPDVSARVEAAVNEAVTAYSTTCTNLKELCTKYNHAADLWKQYKESSDLVREWVENYMDTVADLPPDEAVEAVKVCEETLSNHVEKFALLKNMVSEIANAVGLDSKSLLNSEIEDLGKRLRNVKESLTILTDVAEEQNKSQMERKDKINGTKSLINSIKNSTNGITSSLDNDEQKLIAVRDNLLALSKAESQIQQVRNRTLEISESIQTETTVLEVLELWQEVFKETFQQYHKLSTRLVKNEDAAAALRLWHEYLSNVQHFLQGSIPGDYYSLSDHQHLCQVHKNLLTTQQNILIPLDQKGQVEMSVLEQFNTLTSLHNDTLNNIMDRYNEIEKRLKYWERYRSDQNRLLSWLKDLEKEKEKMQLRYLHIRGINRVISQIDNLLTKMVYGEEQALNLMEQQDKILQFCDDALATSIRMEHAAIKQRLSNLEAGLMTWKQYLERILTLVQIHEERVNKLENIYNNIQDEITNSATESLSTLSLNSKLENLKAARNRLLDTSHDLEELESSQKQLKECLSPSDIKAINQKMWVLKNQRNELDHELCTACQQIEERLGQRAKFETRQQKFVLWADELEKKILKDSQSDTSINDPEELLRKLETDLKAEMILKRREYNWLISTGNELVSSCGDQYSDVTAKQIINSKTNEVSSKWEKLEVLAKSRANKIHNVLDTLTQLERKITEIRAWLTQIEMQLGKPLVFEACTKEVVDHKIQEHEKLKKSIEAESGNIGEVLNLCELLLSDEDIWRAHFRTENLSVAIQNLERRWKNVCGQSAERKRKITFIWKLLQEINKISNEQEEWLLRKENQLKELEKPTNNLSRNELQDLIFLVENEIKEIESHVPIFEILEKTYSKLVTSSGLLPENIQELTSRPRIVITKWNNLLPKANLVLQRLQNEISLFKNFEIAQGDSILLLARIDSKLTELQHLKESKKSPKERLKLLNALELDLNSQNSTLETADMLGLQIMKKGKNEEIKKTQELIDEYQLLWKDIQERIIKLKSEIEILIDQSLPQEVDESIQVETLKFEQDTAVQVNTLPPQLQRMTSISAKDAYLVELSSAIIESKDNQEKLENLINKEVPAQGSTDLSLRGKEIVKLLATCQSNIEVMKHLHDVLIKECNASEEEVSSIQVTILIDRYEDLLSRSKKIQQKIRELSEAGRLICPLCTKRNWAQLDNDLWRLEKWLQVADGTQKTQKKPPSNIEQLEDVIQDHREFVLDLDSHKSIIRSLNIVGTHLADHAEDTDRADKLRNRLEEDNKIWELVCQRAASWERTLQTALIENQQFHAIINELCAWLEKTEEKIKLSEPVDLTVETSVIENKYQAFRELRSELERCEPRVMSLQEAANQLLRQDDSPEGSLTTYRRLTDLRLKLQSLIKLTGVYILKLGAVIGRDPRELGVPLTTSSVIGSPILPSSYDLLDGSREGQPTTSAQGETAHNDGTDDELQINRSVLRKSYTFLGRVLRASLPIQALMLLLLGAASLVPFSEEDDSCSLYTSIANSLSPVLRYNDGRPPI